MNKHNPVNWFEIYVQDMERAKAFYQQTLQVTLEKLQSPDPNLELWAFPIQHQSPGSAGALVKMKGYNSGPGGTLIYFSCEDCAIEAGRAASNGGSVERPKFPIGQYGFIAIVKDTEGNLIGLHSMK